MKNFGYFIYFYIYIYIYEEEKINQLIIEVVDRVDSSQRMIRADKTLVVAVKAVVVVVEESAVDLPLLDVAAVVDFVISELIDSAQQLDQ